LRHQKGIARGGDKPAVFELVFQSLQFDLGGLGDGVDAAELVGQCGVVKIVEAGCAKDGGSYDLIAVDQSG
jgi:hypothetical protein